VFRFESSADQPAMISSSYKRALQDVQRDKLHISTSMAVLKKACGILVTDPDLPLKLLESTSGNPGKRSSDGWEDVLVP